MPLTAEQLAEIRWQTVSGLSREELATQFDERGYVIWPSTMQAPEHQMAKLALAGQLRTIVELVRLGRSVDPAMVSAARKEISRLNDQARRQHNLAKNVSAAGGVRRFMTELDDTVKQLGSPATAQLFDGTFDFQAKDTAELVEHMTRHNLRLAPTSAKGVPVYAKLHSVLAATHRDVFGVNIASR